MTESAVPGLLDTRGHVLRSDALAREVALTVWLPPSYESSDATYPVIYVLDAPMTFAFAAQGALITIFDEAMPEVLVVGVGEPLTTAYQWGANRARDYAPRPVPDDPASGQASAFFDALQAEIVPLVDADYRTDPADRILWGHSFGGAFAVYALLERGGLFHRVIATSPAAFEQGVQLLDPDAWPEQGASCSSEPVHLHRVTRRQVPAGCRLAVRPAPGAHLRRPEIRARDHPRLRSHRRCDRVPDRAQVSVSHD